MQPLTARRDFESLKQEVKAGCGTLRATRSRVEGTGSQWKAQDKYCWNAVLLLGEFAKLPFPLGVKIVHQIGAAKLVAQPLETRVELPAGHVQHGGQRIGPILPNHTAVECVELSKHVGQQLTLQLNHVLWTIYESEFNVQRIIFGYMTARCMWFGSIHVRRLVDPL